MKGSRFTEEQIIGVLREQEAGARTEEVCRRHGVSSATFYKWKSKYGGLEVSDARRLKALEDENRRLKRLLADSLLDNAALRLDVGARRPRAEPQEALSAVPRRAADGAPASRAQAGTRYASTDDAADQNQPALVARLC